MKVTLNEFIDVCIKDYKDIYFYCDNMSDELIKQRFNEFNKKHLERLRGFSWGRGLKQCSRINARNKINNAYDKYLYLSLSGI